MHLSLFDFNFSCYGATAITACTVLVRPLSTSFLVSPFLCPIRIKEVVLAWWAVLFIFLQHVAFVVVMEHPAFAIAVQLLFLSLPGWFTPCFGAIVVRGLWCSCHFVHESLTGSHQLLYFLLLLLNHFGECFVLLHGLLDVFCLPFFILCCLCLHCFEVEVSIFHHDLNDFLLP